MKTLYEIFQNPKKGMAWKWPHYFEIYENSFNKFINKEIKILEIGVHKGGSLWMWKEYFPKSTVVGLDIDPECKKYEGEGVSVVIGDQNNKEDLEKLIKEHGPFDIVLDDGSHRALHQITSHQILFPALNMGGIYMIEDAYGPRIYNYTKKLMNHIQWRRKYSKNILPDEINKDIRSIHIYES